MRSPFRLVAAGRGYPAQGEERLPPPANWPLCLMLRIGIAAKRSFRVAINTQAADQLQLIVPNLHRRYSGVTATNRMVAPKLAKRFRAAWFGSDAPDGIGRMGAADLLKLWRRRRPLIWHARRNNEMRSEEHTSELQSHCYISYAVFCLK